MPRRPWRNPWCYRSAWPTREELFDLTRHGWGARSGLRLQLRTVLDHPPPTTGDPVPTRRRIAELEREFRWWNAEAHRWLTAGETTFALDATRRARDILRRLTYLRDVRRT